MDGLLLDGCRAEPLGSYLKGLGVFRLVAEQLDPGATARWDADRLTITTDRSFDEVVDFFVTSYRPTPIISPWNGGSGFHPKDNLDGISAVEGSATERLVVFRRAIEIGRGLVADERWSELSKQEKVQWCRNELPDSAVHWLDAAVVLTSDGPAFPPLLGTGGNVGRLDFSNNFMQRVAEVLLLGQGRRSPSVTRITGWLHAALTGEGASHLTDNAIGQFDPGAAGGTNAPQGGPEVSVVNPWDFVLTFEGALLFASGAARRMVAGLSGRATMPFTFEQTPVGYGSAADETGKGELWAPLWTRPTSLPELSRLLAEGRAEWSGTQARRGVDAARAAASLGVDRGIDGFVRHALVERMGQAMLAVPVGRFPAQARQTIPVLEDLDRWVERVRRARDLPAAPASALRRLDATMFELARRGGSRALQDVLVSVAELERLVSRSTNLRTKQVPEPVGNAVRRAVPVAEGGLDAQVVLSARRWLPLLNDGSPELRLAAALASGRDRRAPGTQEAPELRDSPAMLLRAVRRAPRRRLEWRPDGRPVVPGLGELDLVPLLGAFMHRRVVDAGARHRDAVNGHGDRDRSDAGVLSAGGTARAADSGPASSRRPGNNRADARTSDGASAPTDDGQVGIDAGFAFGLRAPLGDVIDFVDRRLDEVRLAQLVSALLLLHFDGSAQPLSMPALVNRAPARRAPSAAALVLPFFHGRPISMSRGSFAPGGDASTITDPRPTGRDRVPMGIRLRPAAQWTWLLAAARTDEVIRDACHRLRVARLTPLVSNHRSVSRAVDPRRLLAATAFPLSGADAAALLTRVATADPQL